MIATVLRLALDARMASHVGAVLAGEPDLGPLLECVARRESGLVLVGIHPVDAWMQRRLGPGMSTRGVHGLVAAYSLPWLPWALDVPLVSAVVAARRAASWRCRQTPACARWRTCRKGQKPIDSQREILLQAIAR